LRQQIDQPCQAWNSAEHNIIPLISAIYNMVMN
jgi:hypothetical protein